MYLLNTLTGDLKLVYQNDQYGAMEADEDLNVRPSGVGARRGGQDVFRFNDGKVEPFSSIPAEDSITTNPCSTSPPTARRSSDRQPGPRQQGGGWRRTWRPARRA